MSEVDLKVTVLGWWGTFPHFAEGTSGVLVEAGDEKILFDIGSGVLGQYFLRSDIQHLSACFISHLHFDHMADLGCLGYCMSNALRTEKRTEKLPVYMPATPEDVCKVVKHPDFDAHVLTDGMKVRIGDVTVTVQEIKHTIECYAFKVERNGKSFVYLTDTIYLDNIGDFLGTPDLLICEAPISLGTRHTTGKGHMTDLEAGQTAKNCNAKELCLFHLPSDGDIPLMRERAASVFGKEVYTPDVKREYYL